MDDGKTTLTQRLIDQLIANLYTNIAAQRAQITALEDLAQSRGDDCASIRRVCTQALTALHDEQEAHGRLRERYERVVIENRDLRVRSRLTMECAA